MREITAFNKVQMDVWQWLEAFEHPEKNLHSVRMAGTNGKGSTGSCIAHFLHELKGVPVGHFSSPHVYKYNERITVDGEPISDDELNKIRAAMEEKKKEHKLPDLPYFHQSFIEAMIYYRNLEWAVIETGVGGLEDATNVMPSDIAVITTIDYDHMNVLGESISEIAAHKAGIIEGGKPVYSCYQMEEVETVLQNTAKNKHTEVKFIDSKRISDVKYINNKGMEFKWNGGILEGVYHTALIGLHQVQNISLAMGVAEGLGITDKSILQKAFDKVSMPGRMQHVYSKPDVWIDGAHNDQAVNILLNNLNWMGIKNPRLIFGMHDNKISDEVREKLFSGMSEVKKVLVQDISDDEISLKVREALEEYRVEDSETPIVICGSLYILGAAGKENE